MAYDPNPNWTARTNAGAKSPVYYVTIEGLSTPHYSTAPVRSAAVTKKALLILPDTISQRLSQLQGKSNLNLVSIEIVDRDGEITNLVATEKSSPVFPTLVNRKMTLYSGYADLAEADYAPVAIGQIGAVSMDQRGTRYRFDLVDFRRHARDDLFEQTQAGGNVLDTRLAADAAVGAKTISVAATESIAEGDRLFIGPSTHASYLGQEEKIEVADPGSTIFILKQPLAKAYKAGDEVRWATTVIQGNPVNIVYALLTGDFASASFPLEVAKGLPNGLGVLASEIDTAALILERDRAYSDGKWKFEMTRKVSGQRFLEEKIFRFLGYPFTTIGGKLSLRLYRPVFPDVALGGSGLPTISKSDVLSWRWRRAHDLHVNRIVLGFDFDPQEREPEDRITLEDTADQTATREKPDIEEDETGFSSPLNGINQLEDRQAALNRRFLKPPDLIEVTCQMHKRALEVGEVISFTHPDVPNVKTGTLGITARRLEIVEREERFAGERIILLLQDPQYSRPAAWAPDSITADYDSATAAEKEYAAWAPDAGNFADGGSPYEWV